MRVGQDGAATSFGRGVSVSPFFSEHHVCHIYYILQVTVLYFHDAFLMLSDAFMMLSDAFLGRINNGFFFWQFNLFTYYFPNTRIPLSSLLSALRAHLVHSILKFNIERSDIAIFF
jgi:hypothetical protein